MRNFGMRSMLYSRDFPRVEGGVPLLNFSKSWKTLFQKNNYFQTERQQKIKKEECRRDLIEMERSAFSSRVRVAVHQQNLLSLHRKDSTENAFFESTAQYHAIVFLVHETDLFESFATAQAARTPVARDPVAWWPNCNVAKCALEEKCARCVLVSFLTCKPTPRITSCRRKQLPGDLCFGLQRTKFLRLRINLSSVWRQSSLSL